MPINKTPSKNPASKRDYRHEYDSYQGKPEQIKNRGERNKAHALLEKASGKNIPRSRDVAHITPLDGGGTNTRANERIETVAKNRSWRKGQKGYHVPKDV